MKKQSTYMQVDITGTELIVVIFDGELKAYQYKKGQEFNLRKLDEFLGYTQMRAPLWLV